MQTFLPYASFKLSAQALDDKRLGKQRVETYQVLMQLLGVKLLTEETPWAWVPREASWKHPAMAMWAGHEGALVKYQEACCREWVGRGFSDTCWRKTQAVASLFPLDYRNPEWVGDEEVHLSHQGNLLRKASGTYGPLFPQASAEAPYVWPSATGAPLKEYLEGTFRRAERVYALQDSHVVSPPFSGRIALGRPVA